MDSLFALEPEIGPDEMIPGERIVAFDVETPNWRCDRISAVGVAVVAGGEIIARFASLVNPETDFDAFNVALTGITPEQARLAPTLPQLWGELGPLLQSGLLIAHNAAFDLHVLADCRRHYQLDLPRYVRYACTVQMGRRCYPQLADHRLDTLCRYRGIALDHHRADSDSCACAALFLDYLRSGLRVQPFLRTYDMWRMRTLRRRGGRGGDAPK